MGKLGLPSKGGAVQNMDPLIPSSLEPPHKCIDIKTYKAPLGLTFVSVFLIYLSVSFGLNRGDCCPHLQYPLRVKGALKLDFYL